MKPSGPCAAQSLTASLARRPISGAAVPPAGAQFAAYRIPKQHIDLPKGVRGLVIVPELREVRVQVSFSRFDSVGANLQASTTSIPRR